MCVGKGKGKSQKGNVGQLATRDPVCVLSTDGNNPRRRLYIYT